MKYFLDTEFLEGTQTNGLPFFEFWLGPKRKLQPTIDLISIGIVAEDGREYYAISKDFNLKESWNRFDWKEHKATHKEDEGKILHQKVYWIRENVLRPIFNEWKLNTNSKILRLGLPVPLNELKFNYKNFKYCIKCIGKPNKQIAEEIKEFVLYKAPIGKDNRCKCNQGTKCPNGKIASQLRCTKEELTIKDIQFYGYYSDYDWVVFCWLFGKMIDLPKGFPMYCIDLKQMLDEKAKVLDDRFMNGDEGFDWKLSAIKNKAGYPKQTNEHSAIHDARWNKKLHEFLEYI